MDEKKNLAVKETDTVEIVLHVNPLQLQQFIETCVEWSDLRSQVRGIPAKEMDAANLYHVLAMTGHDVMRDEIEEFRQLLEDSQHE